MTIGHEGVTPIFPEEAPMRIIRGSPDYLKQKTLRTLGLLVRESGEPIEAALVKSVEVYKREHGENEDPKALQAFAEIEAYRSNVVGRSTQEALKVLETGLKPETYTMLEMGVTQLFWDRVNAAYRELQADPEAWKREQEERAAWDATLLDGLEK